MDIISSIQQIYNRIADEKSKYIYMERLNYSITKDLHFLQDMVDRTIRESDIWQSFCRQLAASAAKNDMVIFGAGIWGNILYSETCSFINWKKVIDSNPAGKRVGTLQVTGYKDFMRNYNGEMIVISSYKNQSEMLELLQKEGIIGAQILNAGTVIYELTEKAIYFDLEELTPQEGEVFVDAGCYDGLTTRRFLEWCGGKGYSYCMEPDRQNIASVKNNLGNDKRYEVVNKALWSKTMMLSMNAKGNFATSVTEIGQDSGLPKIEAVSLDDLLENKTVTFIKMDIEGAEAEALRGAEKVIKKYKPRLAVSIYHKTDDIWEIPKIILEYCPDYKLYLRHYSFSYYDTVLYAIS
ncbi:MAG: FkbM family methyltransferase [Lachnospiraceae bacterium]|nr:FkbM family methyltransferase [Lachnospiraceae bacterium]